MENLHEAIRTWAKGIYPLEAGAELLCRTSWAQRLYEAGYVDVDEGTVRLPDGGWGVGMLAYPRVGDFLRSAGYLSGGERRQLTIICSFLNQDDNKEGMPIPVSLYEDLPGVDLFFIRLVQAAVGHAAGLHEQTRNATPWPVDA
jgi:hypothetical protein